VDLASSYLGWTFKQKLFFRPLFGWHLAGVLSSSKTVNANIGVRSPKTIELQQERKMELEQEKRIVALKARQIVVVKSCPLAVPVQVYL
jgi:hypothetical protein